MNLRQKAKKLKQQNAFLHHIINNNPEMKRLYNELKKPLNVVTSYKELKKFKCVRLLERGMVYDDGYIKYMKVLLRDDIAKGIEPFIDYKVDKYRPDPLIEASIYIVEMNKAGDVK